MIDILFWIVCGLFPISEITLAVAKRSRGRAAQREDRGSMRLLWLSIVVGMTLAWGAQWVPAGRLHLSRSVTTPMALGLLVVGLAIRWTAIVTLGRFFTVDVAIHSDHAVVHTGLYRVVRHPSYTGLLMAFLGVGVFYDNWLSILGCIVPIALGVLYRVSREERALLDSLGAEYAAYCARTKRFIPGLL